MDLNEKSRLLVKHQIFHGTMAKRVLLRSFLIAVAFSVIPLFVILTGPYLKMLAPINSGGCSIHLNRNFQGRHLNPIWSSVEPTRCRELANSIEAVVRDLISRNIILNPIAAKALCIGEASDFAAKTLREALGFSFSDSIGNNNLGEISSKNASFDFVLELGSDKAELEIQIERFLISGGIGAVMSEYATSAFSPARLKHSRVVLERVDLLVFKKNESFIGEEEEELFLGEENEKKNWFRKFGVLFPRR